MSSKNAQETKMLPIQRAETNLKSPYRFRRFQDNDFFKLSIEELLLPYKTQYKKMLNLKVTWFYAEIEMQI